MENDPAALPQDQPSPAVPSGDASLPEEEMTTLHERTIATLSYMGFFAIIPFYLQKDSKFCRFHGKQGMLLALIFFIAKLLTVIDVFMDIVLIIQVGIFFYMGMAAVSGKWKKLPFVYDWACKMEEALSLKTKEQEEAELRLDPMQIDPAQIAKASRPPKGA